MYTLQFVQESIKKSTSFFMDSTKKYVLGLLLSTGRKNCSSMSSSLGISYNSIYRYFDDFHYQKDVIQEFFISLVNLYATKEKPGVLILDTSQILKLYAQMAHPICYDFNNSMKFVAKGMSCVTCAWTNGDILIPLDFDFWIREKDLKCGKKYRKRTAITKELILKLKDKLLFGYIALDGEYGSEDFIRFLYENGLYFSIRMPKNRKVLIDGFSLKLKDQPIFQLKRNERYKTARGWYKGIPAYFTSHKRKGKNNTKQIVFVVSNLEGLTPKEQIEAYSCRWPIEKMFRSLKQSLGFQQCQCSSEEKQRAHIFATFLAFTELEMQKINKKKSSPEQVLKILRAQNTSKINLELVRREGFIV